MFKVSLQCFDLVLGTTLIHAHLGMPKENILRFVPISHRWSDLIHTFWTLPSTAPPLLRDTFIVLVRQLILIQTTGSSCAASVLLRTGPNLLPAPLHDLSEISLSFDVPLVSEFNGALEECRCCFPCFVNSMATFSCICWVTRCNKR